MRIFVGDKILNMSSEELDKLYLNEGSEGVIYKVNKEVLKIYKDNPLVSRLSLDEINILRKIKCNRFVMPKDVILLDGESLIGYSSPFIDSESIRNIFELDGESFKKEIKLLLEDLKLLAMNGVEIDDLHLDNLLLSNKKIFIIDPGNYSFSKEDNDEVMRSNIFRFHNFIINDLISLALAKKYRKKLDVIFSQYDDIEKFLATMNDFESVKDFANRIVK